MDTLAYLSSVPSRAFLPYRFCSFCCEPSAAFSHHQRMAKQASTCVGESALQFPLYLLPPLPFFRSARTNLSDAAEAKKLQATKLKAKKKRKKQTRNVPDESEVSDGERALHGHTQYLKCRKCQSDLCFASCIISKGVCDSIVVSYSVAYLFVFANTSS